MVAGVRVSSGMLLRVFNCQGWMETTPLVLVSQIDSVS